MPFLKKITNDLIVTSPETLEWQGKSYKCYIGKGGVKQDKIEGDGCTPAGTFPLRKILYRPDRVRSFTSDLPMEIISPADGWCDDATDSLYNQKIKLPYAAHHEVLWRYDTLYDVLIVVGYNDCPPVSCKGSAIFIHLADSSPTAGCVTLHRNDFFKILSELKSDSRLVVPDDLDTTISSPMLPTTP
jgi:L,D-peptidoglycan transpeptidase YkuD (ErfK/YbiS/YcfS/YnhG family)